MYCVHIPYTDFLRQLSGVILCLFLDSAYIVCFEAFPYMLLPVDRIPVNKNFGCKIKNFIPSFGRNNHHKKSLLHCRSLGRTILQLTPFNSIKYPIHLLAKSTTYSASLAMLHTHNGWLSQQGSKILLLIESDIKRCCVLIQFSVDGKPRNF